MLFSSLFILVAMMVHQSNGQGGTPTLYCGDTSTLTSCLSDTIYSTFNVVYCYSYLSCSYANVYAERSNIYCYDPSSCRGSSTAYPGYYVRPYLNLYCESEESCYGHQLRSYSTDYSHYYYFDVYCRGRRSCLYAIITQFGSIYCESEWSCSRSQILNVESVYCRGSKSCYYAAISSSFSDTQIDCSGEQSCWLSSISGNISNTIVNSGAVKLNDS